MQTDEKGNSLPLQRLREQISDDIDGILIISPENRIYFSGVNTSDGYMLITRSNAYFFADSRYFGYVKESLFSDITPILSSGLSTVLEYSQNSKITKLGFEDNYVTVEKFEQLKLIFKGIEFIKFNGLIERLRQVKFDFEISKIKGAQHLTEIAFMHILPFLKEGVSERDIALELEYFIKKSGGDGIAFETICAFGENSAIPHHHPTDKKLTYGNMIKIDFGAKLGFYCSDMTRTLVFGTPTTEQKSVYQTVLEAQILAINFVKSGVIGEQVDKVARDFIRKNGYGDYFGHGLGHGLGINIHEIPRFSPGYKNKIPKGAVITVEPGIYLPDKFGVRIEDMILVTEDGFVNLTNTKKELYSL